MRHPLLLAGILQVLALPALAGGAGSTAGVAGYAEGERPAAFGAVQRSSGVVALTRDTQLAYELGADEAALSGRVTTRHRLSKTEMLNLRLERDGGGAYWSRRHRGREQRLGLFTADFGLADQRVLGWEYADGYPLGEEVAPSRGPAWSGTPLRAARRFSPLGAPAPASVADAIGDRVRNAFTREHDRIGQEVRAEAPVSEGRRDLKFAAGGSADTGAPFVGGAWRQGLTPEWTVEAGGYADRDAALYARSRLRLGGGVLKLETRGDDSTGRKSRRAAYVFRHAAVAAERHQDGGAFGARLYGSRYYAAVDRGVGDGDSRLALGYSTRTRLGRMTFQCEAREGEEDSRYCGVGMQIPLQRRGISAGGGRGLGSRARPFY